MIVFQKHGSTENVTIAIAMKLEKNYYYFWSLSESVIFQVERLAEFHCACQSQGYSLPSNSSSFTYLLSESRTQKCPHREPPWSRLITTQSLSGFPVSVPTVLPSGRVWCLHCSDCRVKSRGRLMAQRTAWQGAEAGSPKSHPRSLGTASSFLSSAV